MTSMRIPLINRLASALVLLLPAITFLTATPVVAHGTTPTAVYDPSTVDTWLADVKAKYAGQRIVMAMASHPSTTAFQEVIKRFEQGTDVTVEFDVMEEGALGEKLLLECSSKSSTYDIFMTAVERVTEMAETGCERPIDQFIATAPAFYDYNDLMAAYRDLFLVNGQMYAIPFAGESVFLMYRKDLFEQAGITVPKTWDELRALAKQFHDGGAVEGVAFRARKGWEFTYTYSVLLFPFGGRILDPETGKAAINTQGSIDALNFMKSLKAYAPVGIESFSFPEAWQSMQNGKVAMLVEATAAAPELENPAKSQVAGKVGYAVLPAGPAGAYTGVWGWGLGINAASSKAELAWDVIVWLTSRYTHQQYVDLGGIVSRSSAFEDPINRAKYPFFEATEQALEQAAALTAQGLSVVPKTSAWSQISEVMGSYGSEAFVGQISAEQAVAKMQEEIEAILATES